MNIASDFLLGSVELSNMQIVDREGKRGEEAKTSLIGSTIVPL